MITQVKAFLSQKNNLIILVIVIIAAFLRFYKIADYMTFLGDEGRDVLTVKHILEGELTFLGPRSSAADFYYGPIYYYLITPFLLLFNFDPVGPAIFIGILGVITVYLVYLVGRKFFNPTAGLIAAALYALSPVVVAYSHSSWNPNPLPLVSLVTLYLLYSGLKNPAPWKFVGVGILLGIAMQLQYLALFLVAIVGVYTLVGSYIQEKKQLVLQTIKRVVMIGVGLTIGWSPFLAFEVFHGFPNVKTLFNLLLGKYPETVLTHSTPLGQILEVFFKLFGRLVTAYPLTNLKHISDTPQLFIWYLLTLALGIVSVVTVLKIKDKLAKALLLCWIVMGVCLFAFYKKEIYDYYLGFMFTLPFLLLGNFISLGFMKSRNVLSKGLTILLVVILIVLNILNSSLWTTPNKQKEQTKKIAEFVISKADNKPFNFALITPGNSDHGYRYFLEVLGHKPVEMENQLNDPERKTVTDQLLVVCEDIKCSPLGYSLFDVAGFGRAEITGEWNTSVVKVFRLVHYKE